MPRPGAAAATVAAGRLDRSASLRIFVAMLVAALNLRIGIAVVGPLIEQMRDDTGMPSALAGVLTTLPFVCMGVFAFTGPAVVARQGTRSVLAWSLGLIGVGSLLRAFAPSSETLIATTVPVGVGMALAGVTIPIVVKQYFPDRPGATTGAYTTAMCIGISVMGLTAVPLASALGSWRDAFALSAAPALLALPAWLAAAPARPPRPAAAIAVTAPRPAGGIGVYLGLLFGVQSFSFAAVVSWGPAILEDAGWSATAAALAVSIPSTLSIVAALTVPALTDRGGRRGWLLASTVVLSGGLATLAIAPGDLGMVAIVAFGLGSGTVLPLCFALPLDYGRTPERVGVLAASMLGIGHLIAALGPTMTGALRELSGGFTLAVAVVFAISLADIVLAAALPEPRR